MDPKTCPGTVRWVPCLPLRRVWKGTVLWCDWKVRLFFWYGHLLRIHGESRSIATDPCQVARSVAMDRYSPKIRCYGPIFTQDPLLSIDTHPRSVAMDRYSPKIRCYGPIFTQDPLLSTDTHPRSVAMDRYSPKIRCYGPILTQDPLLSTDTHPRSVAMDRYSPKIRCYTQDQLLRTDILQESVLMVMVWHLP